MFLTLCLIPTVRSQTIDMDSLRENFSTFMALPEENIYIHLNKKIFLDQEDIGFTSYTINKKTQLPFKETRNVYAQLIDQNRNVVVEQMLFAENGQAAGIFPIDSLIKPGDYNIKVFTNWMRNFDNPDYGTAALSIISTKQQLESLQKEESVYDVQFLPEAGAAIHNVFTRVGVIAKDQYGNGKEGKVVIQKNGSAIQELNLDKNGISSFMWLPDATAQWDATVKIDGQQRTLNLPTIEQTGIHVEIAMNMDKMGVGIATNEDTFEEVAYDKFYVFINGHSKLIESRLELIELKRSYNIPLDSIQSGMNQLTLLSEEGEIIAKRVFFNHQGFEYEDQIQIDAQTEMDSVNVNVNFEKVKDGKISISVLPTRTATAVTDRNIVNKFKFKPYIKGNIQNLMGYFPLDNMRSIQALDNMLICQGWQVYDWDKITQVRKARFPYPFEEGITLEGTVNGKKFDRIMLYGTEKNNLEVIDLESDSRSFAVSQFFPVRGERLRVSGVKKKGKTTKIGLYPRFTPSSIPEINFDDFSQTYLEAPISEVEIQPFSNMDGELETVVVEADPNEERNERIKNLARGRVDIFDDNDRRRFIDIGQYLLQNGFRVTRNAGLLDISYFSAQRFQDPRPAFIIDGITFDSAEVLIGFDMSIVDYIEIDATGTGKALGRFGIPIVKIVTDPSLSPFKDDSTTFSTFGIPLTFSKPKDFYKPRYYSYSTSMFDKLGVVDWKGNVTIVDGKASFTMPFLGMTEVKIIVEGITPDGLLIHDIQDVIIK